MTIRDLVESERRRILEEAVEILTEREDDEDVLRRFLPLAAHARSLSPHALVVVGERGAGKTALFRFLGALVRKGVPVGSVFRNVPGDLPWHEGFSEFGRDHPATAQVIGFASGASREDMRRFWFAHLVGRLGEWAGAQGVGPPEPFFLTWRSRRNEPHLWVAEASRQAGALQGWLDSLDADLSSRGDRVVVSYDHIDRLRDAGSPRLPERMGGELLALWLALGNRHRAIQGKVFLRHDLY
ncbi:hypothetical protein L6R50_19450 [Myxococcota bacterium]|nr:hypothetical protein [Myxococcota bacterium]